MVFGIGALVGFGGAICHTRPAKAMPAASQAAPGVLPEAMPRGVQLAACNPCNPCAAVNPCNPCAAAACNPCAAVNPCNPCAAVNPCNPCAAAAGGATECVVPRLQVALAAPCNPCTAAANPCNPCAAAVNPCNPCAAVNPCNPCVAANPCAAANPCNPCAAAVNPCNPCAAAANPCNPCAAAANPCNPCAAAANPCNPCAAAANPCNPCAAAANPCNPCAAAGSVELTDAEAATVYECLKGYVEVAYGVADDPAARQFLAWTTYSLVPYVSDTHGSRYVMNYADGTAAAEYGQYEAGGTLPAGSRLAKNSFVVGADGKAALGPLFLMQKMARGFSAASGDWSYTMIMPDGTTFGSTAGPNAGGVEFCNECHALMAEDQDYLFFLPEEYRTAKN